MIKTESGEMIEPRVGDVIRWDDGSGYDDAMRVVRAEKLECINTETENHCWPVPECCTLLHRPFQVGDEVVIRQSASADMGYCERWEETHTLDASMLDDLSIFEPEHKNPAWRDHSEWKGVK